MANPELRKILMQNDVERVNSFGLYDRIVKSFGLLLDQSCGDTRSRKLYTTFKDASFVNPIDINDLASKFWQSEADGMRKAKKSAQNALNDLDQFYLNNHIDLQIASTTVRGRNFLTCHYKILSLSQGRGESDL